MIAATTDSPKPGSLFGEPGAGPEGAKTRWAKFLAGALGILVFAFGVVPALEQLGPVREMRDSLEDTNIDATTLIYGESEESLEARLSLQNAILYAPERPDERAASNGDGRDDLPAQE